MNLDCIPPLWSQPCSKPLKSNWHGNASMRLTAWAGSGVVIAGVTATSPAVKVVITSRLLFLTVFATCLGCVDWLDTDSIDWVGGFLHGIFPGLVHVQQRTISICVDSPKSTPELESTVSKYKTAKLIYFLSERVFFVVLEVFSRYIVNQMRCKFDYVTETTVL